jgi:hypothetical protein
VFITITRSGFTPLQRHAGGEVDAEFDLPLAAAEPAMAEIADSRTQRGVQEDTVNGVLSDLRQLCHHQFIAVGAVDADRVPRPLRVNGFALGIDAAPVGVVVPGILVPADGVIAQGPNGPPAAGNGGGVEEILWQPGMLVADAGVVERVAEMVLGKERDKIDPGLGHQVGHLIGIEAPDGIGGEFRHVEVQVNLVWTVVEPAGAHHDLPCTG